MLLNVRVILFLIFFLPGHGLVAQEENGEKKADTTRSEKILNGIGKSKFSKRVMKSITRKSSTDPMAGVKSEEAFLPFEGKIIRNIRYSHIDFQKTVYDTTRNIRTIMAKWGNALHSNSRQWLIRDNLFIQENRPLNPYKLADNERYLRDLDFILDARFYIVPLSHTEDSIDVVVLTRDVFSLGATINPLNPSRTRFRIYDTNLAGWGQRVQFNGLIEDDRDPAFIYEALYRKNSVGGSFVNATVGYTELNNGSSYGEEEEKSLYVRLERPLVSPYTRLAGGVEISRNWSSNFFSAPDTLFRDYRYRINDFWIGYNVGARNNMHNRSRHFISLRAFDQYFTRQPLQSRESNNPIYNNLRYILGAVTFFKQNFYTTRYIFGFGRTEDVPYGHNVSLLGGWSEQLGLRRPYLGVEAERLMVRRNGEFYTVGLRAGAFHHKGVEDAIVLLSGSLTSRLIARGDWLFRQSFHTDYTRVFRQRTSLPLDINNEFGLQNFSADSLEGTKRFHLLSETLAFSPWVLLGFRFAPFAFGEMAMIAPESKSIFYEKPFFGFGGGIRTRNENLVFGTVELRVIYHPIVVEDLSKINVRISTNLRVKYSARFVRRPAFIRYN